MLIRKPLSDTTSTRTWETSPRFSNTEQIMDDDFTLNETFWNDGSTNDQILPDAFDALFPLDLDTTTTTTTTTTSTHPSADTPLQRHHHDSGSALSVTTNASASPSNSTTYRPPTAEMYNLNMNPLATSMSPSDWVASPKQAQATSSSSNNFFSATGSNSNTATTVSSTNEPFVNPNPYLSTTQCDDFLWTETFPTSTTSASTHPISTRKLSKATRPSQQDRTDPKHLVGETSSLDEDMNNDFEERLARKRRRLAKGASMGTTKGRTTLVLEDVEPETLKTVMDTLLQSKTRMSMTHGIDDGIAD